MTCIRRDGGCPTRMRARTSRALLVVAGVLCLLFGTTAQAQKDVSGCKPVLDALLWIYSVPNHSIGTRSGAGIGDKPEPMEAISTNAAYYLRKEGKWIRVPVKRADMIAQKQDNIKSATAHTCRAIRQESVNGVPATLFAVATQSEDDKSAGQFWVAKGSGLLLRQDVDNGLDDPSSKTHVSLTYDHSNVQAPAGVQ